MKKILGVYHLACLNDYIDIFSEQFDLLHSSGLYTASNKLLIYITSFDNNPILNKKLKEYDPDNKFLIFKLEENVKEKFAINDFGNHIEDESYMFYFHAKRVSITLDDPKYFFKDQWRKILNFYTISKWKINLKLIKKYDADAAGCFFFLNPLPHFSGNFWWAKINYAKNLPNCGDNYLAPEMFICSDPNGNFVSLVQNPKHILSRHINREDEDIFNNITIRKNNEQNNV